MRPTHAALPAPSPPGPVALKSKLLASFVWSAIVPLLLLAFFLVAPRWLNAKTHAQIKENIRNAPGLSVGEQTRRLAAFAEIDFAALAFHHPPQLARLHADLEHAGVMGNFQRLHWSLRLALALNAGLLGITAATLLLNSLARTSREALIRYYRICWHLGMVAALAQVCLLVPLLVYGVFELTALAMDRFFPQVLFFLGLGGLIALWKTGSILCSKVPLEFDEPMSRAVSERDAPEVWAAVRAAAHRLGTTPPDQIVVGMQMNFYVTELAVKHAFGRVAGRTLFLSQPLLKQLSADEVLAIIGHELGHFIGEDTQLTRDFYPLRFKVQATMMTLAQSGPTAWTSLQSLNFFGWCFGATEQEFSRQRELLADRKAAELSSAATFARALVKFHVVDEAYRAGLEEALRSQVARPLDLRLGAIIRDRLLPRTAFWTELFEKKSPHPLDSHPALHTRLESLGQVVTPDDAKTMATSETESAFAIWFSGRESLFTGIEQEADAGVNALRARVQVAGADLTSAAGRELLQAHFPELRVGVRARTFWLVFLFVAFLAALALACVFMSTRDWSIQMICALISTFLAWSAFVLWRRHRRAELVLTADGLSHSGWRRPLRFADVQAISAHSSCGLTLIFILKSRQPVFWRHALYRYPRKTVSLPLGWLNAKESELAQTICRYFKRELPEAKK